MMASGIDTALPVPGRRRKKPKIFATTISVLLVLLSGGTTVLRTRNGVKEFKSYILPSTSNGIERGRRNLTSFERHYLGVYKSMMIDKTAPPKFVLWKLDPRAYGFGNKMRSLNGAMFAAAITNRVLLVDCPPFTSLFDPPILDGIVLDWDVNLATTKGMCTNAGNSTRETNSSTVLLYQEAGNGEFAKYYVNFASQYSNTGCLVASASHGHDRQIASYNERTYKDKVERLFGHSTSRYNWSRHTLGLVMQRLKPQAQTALRGTMGRLGLLNVLPERRIGIHIRTFFDQASDGWVDAIMEKKHIMLDCIHSLIREKLEHIQQREITANAAIALLFVSDNNELKRHAKANITARFPSVRFLESGLDVVHTGNSTKSVEPSVSAYDAFLEWLLLGECSMVIGTGFSSFGLTSYFRPGTFPYQPTCCEDREDNESKPILSTKDLYTIDQLVSVKRRFMNMENKMCGRIEPKGYDDINFGLMDAMHKPKKNRRRQPLTKGGTIKGKVNLFYVSSNR